MVIPLHKKCVIINCDNYRLIALQTHISKVMLQFNPGCSPSLIDRLSEQAEFVRGRGTKKQILNLRQLIKKAREDLHVHLCGGLLSGYVKTFDKIKWHSLWPIFIQMGIPGHLVQLIKNLYKNSIVVIAIENCLSTECAIRKGMRQGCILSSLLFNPCSKYLMRAVLDGWKGGIVMAVR